MEHGQEDPFNMSENKASVGMSKVTSCCVDVILKNYTLYKDFESHSNIKKSLSKYCKDILLYSILSAKQKLNVSKHRLSRVYGISHLIVQRIGIQNNSLTGVVSRSTKLSIKSIHSEDFYRFSQEVAHVTKLGGLNDESKKVLQLLQLNQATANIPHRPVGIMIHGPPGCGKTSFVKKIALDSGAVLFKVDGSDLLKSEFGAGQDCLKQVFEKAVDLTSEGPVILFFDELDILCPRPEKASLGNKQLASAMMVEIDNLQRRDIAGLLVISTTNAISAIDPLLRRPGRFDHEVLINVPNQQQRVSILHALTSDFNLAPDICLTHLARRTPGFVGADLHQLCEEAVNHALARQDIKDILMVGSCDFESALQKVIPSLKKSSECVVDLQPVLWDEIGGLYDVKAEIKQSVEWPLLFPEALSKMDITPPRGLLLYGPPGCCKTTLVKATATSSHVSFLSLTGAQAYSPYVGESERIISEAFQKARALAPSILFLDEIESIVGKRTAGSGQSRVQERILSTLLNEMDGIGTRLDHNMHCSEPDDANQKTLKHATDMTGPLVEASENRKSRKHASSLGVLLVGATNRPDMLDPAILRPGRLDRHIYVPPPDLSARKAILKIYTAKMPCYDDLDLDNLSDVTNFYTGADLKNLCKEAGLVALREHMSQLKGLTDTVKVAHRHFIQALHTVRASLSEDVLQQYKKR